MSFRNGFIIVFVLFFGTSVIAAEPPKAGPAAAEFKKIHAEFNAMNAELQLLQLEYRNAPREDRPSVEKKWKVKYHEGELLQARFFEAAEKAFIESPNADPKLFELLQNVFSFQISTDDYENALRLGKLLFENGHEDKYLAAMLGLSAVAVGDFPVAKTYFDKAQNLKAFEDIDPKNQLLLTIKKIYDLLPELEKKWNEEQKIRETEAKADNLPRVLLKTEKGDIVIELFENEAPNTVANFLTLAEKKFYNGLTFHRVLEQFVAQGGDPLGTGAGGPGYTIPCECTQPNHRNHFRGSLSMAHAGPNTGGSQFFLCFLPTWPLDGKHTVFGRVVSGFDVLAKIQRRNPEDPNAPDPDKILEVKVLRKQDHEYKVKKTGE